ncbi:hypothetical protein LTR56_014149 [Elasticomyces elasticus]|nr:hypothetical protein LTR56_014149 [Elasticomyces elasticus]KAK3662757.1 hypothetical protein LTR22_006373 [Elasticomyces elasticus]KAK4918019.1 hypothetical protein LTR49_014157 [Elasticomyces elasticus]KAK5754483.1 hypothetical protein LTS12_015438 [Elasticomyces elasticus]
MASQNGEETPTAEDLAIMLQEILGSAHRVAPSFRKLLREQARSFLDSVKPFRLLDLPRELRDVIYRYATVEDEHLLLSGPCTHQDWPKAVQPAITRVNRQLRHEILPMFYTENTFEAHITNFDFGFFLSHMQVIGPQNLSCIQHVVLSNTRGNYKSKTTCAAGVFDFVRWYVSTQAAGGIQFGNGPPRQSEVLIYDAISLALESRQQGKTSEARLRDAFGLWLWEKGGSCHCSDAGDGWDDPRRHCSIRKQFSGDYDQGCEVDHLGWLPDHEGW